MNSFKYLLGRKVISQIFWKNASEMQMFIVQILHWNKKTFSPGFLCPTKMDTGVLFYFPIWSILEWQWGTCRYCHYLVLWLQCGPGLQATIVLFGQSVSRRVRNSRAEHEGRAGIWRELNQWALFEAEGRVWKTTSSGKGIEGAGSGQKSVEMKRRRVPGTQGENCGAKAAWSEYGTSFSESVSTRQDSTGILLTLLFPPPSQSMLVFPLVRLNQEPEKTIDAICTSQPPRTRGSVERVERVERGWGESGGLGGRREGPWKTLQSISESLS